MQFSPHPSSIATENVFPNNLADVQGIVYCGSLVEIARITDGTSKTYMIAEKYLKTDSHTDGSDYTDSESAYTGNNDDSLRSPSVPPLQDQPGLEPHYKGFGSSHPGIWQVAMCDGSAQSLTFDIELALHCQNGSRAGGDCNGQPTLNEAAPPACLHRDHELTRRPCGTVRNLFHCGAPERMAVRLMMRLPVCDLGSSGSCQTTRCVQTCCLLVALVAGCNATPGRIPGVDVNCDRAAEALLNDYDRDGNGGLSESELVSVPPIHGNRRWYDVDGDGEISQAELRAGLVVIFDPKIGLLSTWCNVTRSGKPLAGANVEFVPLPALESVIPTARAVTDDRGIAKLAISDEDLPANAPRNLPLVRPGLYLIKVSHSSVSIPAKFNAETTLGKEISNHSTAGGPLKIDLKF